MTVYRIHIRPKGGKAIPEMSFDYCLKKRVLGVGWQIKSKKSGISWDEYEEKAMQQYGNAGLSRVRYLKTYVKANDLIWTRDTRGNYYLAKVLSEWEYYTSKQAEDADITNVVRCKILQVQSVDDVPGKVVACFTPSSAIQAIRDKGAENYSLALWNKLSGTEEYIIKRDESQNIFTLLNSEQTEDVIFIYLQTIGWIVIPNSRKADMMSYEFYLINRQDQQRAIVQVKTGWSSLDALDWKHRKERVFLFQSNGRYLNTGINNVECIEPKTIEEFIYNNLDLMPGNIALWSRVARGEM